MHSKYVEQKGQLRDLVNQRHGRRSPQGTAALLQCGFDGKARSKGFLWRQWRVQGPSEKGLRCR